MLLEGTSWANLPIGPSSMGHQVPLRSVVLAITVTGCPHPQAELSSSSFLEESWVHEIEAVLPFLPEPEGWSGLTAMRAPSSAALDSLLAAVTSDFAGIFH